MTDDDEALARRAAQGDEAAFELLVQRHIDAVWRFSIGVVGDATAAEDLTQEAFIKAHRSLETFRGDAAFRTWLLSIAKRSCLDHMRRGRQDVTSLDEVRAERAREVDATTRVALERAIGELPEDERSAFMLVDALGLSREEAARLSDCPASTLKSRLARAHIRLVEALREDEPRAHRRSTR